MSGVQVYRAPEVWASRHRDGALVEQLRKVSVRAAMASTPPGCPSKFSPSPRHISSWSKALLCGSQLTCRHFCRHSRRGAQAPAGQHVPPSPQQDLASPASETVSRETSDARIAPLQHCPPAKSCTAQLPVCTSRARELQVAEASKRNKAE